MSLAVGDLGPDSDPDTVRRDVVLVSLGSATLSVLSNHGHAGVEGSFIGLVPGSPRAVASGDMSGDGRPDLVIADTSNQVVRIVLNRVLARNDSFGTGCPGTDGRRPSIVAIGAPMVAQQPNPTFGILMVNARPLAPAFLIASAAAAAGPSYPACSFVLANPDILLTRFTNLSGEAVVPIPVRPTPVLVGGVVYFQWAALDLAGGFLGQLSLTEGLKVRVGF